MIDSEQVNQLIDVTYHYLSRQVEPVTERQLLIELTEHDMWDGLGKSSAIIQQFQKHFLAMHTLYRLQDMLKSSRQRLEISPNAIYIRDLDDPNAAAPFDKVEDESSTDPDEVLKDYYLDLSQLKTHNGTIANSPDDYRRQHCSSRQHRESYAALELNTDASWLAVQSAFRQKAVQYHPDKGGSAQDFQKVRDAYQDLKRALRP